MPYCQCSECEKKGANSGGANTDEGAGHSPDSLESFQERLQNIPPPHGTGDGSNRAEEIAQQAEQAVAVASELGLLKEPTVTWAEFRESCLDAISGAEHIVELDPTVGLMGKTTIPPGFGLIPEIRELPTAVLSPDDATPRTREAIEFIPASIMEYLSRWIACNEIFGDDVNLASVIRWKDGLISLGITQPQYHGEPTSILQIEEYFRKAGWTRLHDPSGHGVYFNYAFGVLAIDAETRNCYVNDAGLQPFDVVLCQPNEKLERFLNIYPD